MPLISFGPHRIMPAAQDMLDEEQMRALAISILYTEQQKQPVTFSHWYSIMSLHFRTHAKQQSVKAVLDALVDVGSVRQERGLVFIG